MKREYIMVEPSPNNPRHRLKWHLVNSVGTKPLCYIVTKTCRIWRIRLLRSKPKNYCHRCLLIDRGLVLERLKQWALAHKEDYQRDETIMRRTVTFIK